MSPVAQSASSGTPPVDRRVRRTRSALQRSLIDLVLRDGFNSVTVEHIAEHADLSRATFYVHFPDKLALLTSIADDLIGDVIGRFEEHPPDSHGAVVRAAFAHVAAHRTSYQVLLSGAGNGVPLDRALDLATEFGERMIHHSSATFGVAPRLPVDAVARIWSGELIAAMRWWASGTTPYTADEVADMLMHTRFYGLAWVYGRAPGDETLAATELNRS